MTWLERPAHPHFPKHAEVLTHDGKASAAAVSLTCFVSLSIRICLLVDACRALFATLLQQVPALCKPTPALELRLSRGEDDPNDLPLSREKSDKLKV